MSLKIFIPLGMIFLVLLSGCTLERERLALEERGKRLDSVEQDLLLREKNLLLKIDSLDRLIKSRDTLVQTKDTIMVLPAQYTGDWLVKAVTSKTNCPGAAVGDSRTDTWQFATQDSAVVIKAINKDKQVSRIYTGNYFSRNIIKARSTTAESPASNVSKVEVDINSIAPNKMTGTRIVTQPDGCTIEYNLEITKSS